MSQEDEFPKYLMKMDGNREFMNLWQAGKAYDNGFARVSFGRYVLNEDFSIRPMTDEDRALISSVADEHSGNK